ncbi:MAG: DUF4870 domain-containing protein [Chloroflexota bacterium]|nr:DUF4870 domain-containing protein [Chloroflexota bacterium]
MVDQVPSRLQPRAAADRRLAALAHAAGVLGLSLGGWVAAAAVSIAVLFLAEQRRSRYLAVHSGQSALYQLAVFALHLLIILWLGAGFLSFGGEIPGVGDWRIFDALADPWLTIVQVIWGVSLVLWPVFYLATVVYALIGAWRTARGETFWYPLVSQPIRRQFERRPAPPPGIHDAAADSSLDETRNVQEAPDVQEERPAV